MSDPTSDFEVVRELARGGMARILLARNRAGELRVLKVMREDQSDSSSRRQRFEREATLAKQLQHRHIARVFGVKQIDGALAIEMEVIDGLTVRELIDRAQLHERSISFSVTISIIQAVLDALEYAHELRDEAGRPLEIVHRDLSPNNLMVSRSGEIKIIDFGAAHAEIEDFKTAPAVRLGTLRYMSPEQALSRPVDRRSDLYTVGAVLFELVSGTPLVAQGQIVDILEAVGFRAAPALTPSPDVPVAMTALIATALKKNPEQRFQSAREFREALAAITTPRSSEHTLAELVRALESDDEGALDRTRAFPKKSLTETITAVIGDTVVVGDTVVTSPKTSRGAPIAALLVLVGLAFVFFPKSQAPSPVASPASMPLEPQVLARDATVAPEVESDEPPPSTPQPGAPQVGRLRSRNDGGEEREVKPERTRRFRQRLRAATSPTDLLDLHDAIEDEIASTSNLKLKAAVESALVEFRFGGGEPALRRAVELIEP